MMLGGASPPPGMGMGFDLGTDTDTTDKDGLSDLSLDGQDADLMRIMTQLLGGAGGGGAGAGAGPNPFGFPPAAGGAQTQPGTTTTATPARGVSIWSILHLLLAVSLGLTIALTTPFTGSKSSRDRAAAAAAGSLAEQLAPDAAGSNFFWAFATAEAVLLTTRHVVERERSRLPGGGSGLLGMVVGFLPAGVRAKVEMAVRYGEVLGAVRRDLLVCLFVLGGVGWWRG